MPEKINSLPKPTGPFRIGCTHLSFIDENRVDPSSLAGGKKRDVPIIIWYPADNPGNFPPLKFLKQQDLDSLKHFFFYKLIPKEFCEILTNSHKDAPISVKNRNFPLLIFNHGLTSFMEQNTIMMEYLASDGYIVVSVGHPYDGVASYPDGRSIPMDVNYYEDYFERAMTEEKDKKDAEYFKQMQREDITIEDMKNFTENNLLNENLLNDRIEVWVDDILFIKDILERMNEGVIGSQFEGKMDIEKGIGLFGHSYGGAASILSCCLDERLRCAINMDGSMFGGLKERFKYKQPSMFMYSGASAEMNRYFYSVNENDTYSVHIKDSTHFDYFDISYIIKSSISEIPEAYGKIDGEQMVKITNDYVLSFFNKYIRSIESPLLESTTYSEVNFEKRNK